jgi:hypothetical protein
MNGRFRPIWLVKALAFEVYYQTKRRLNLSGQPEREKIRAIVADFERLKEQESRYLKLLLGKYPDQAWASKYVKAGLGMSVPGILALHTLETKELHSIWTNEATLADCKTLLKVKHPFTTVIRQNNGTPHAVLVYGHSERRHEFYFRDTLGSYNASYKLQYGGENWISEVHLTERNVGHPIHLMVLFREVATMELFRRHFRRQKHYWV